MPYSAVRIYPVYHKCAFLLPILFINMWNAHFTCFSLAGRSLNKKASGLADLFRPPLDLLYKGSYEKAMSHAIKKSCWLLINVQDPGIFDCQLLNRDTWSDESVKEIIKSSFIMVQLYNGSETASEYTYVQISEMFQKWVFLAQPFLIRTYTIEISETGTLSLKHLILPF